MAGSWQGRGRGTAGERHGMCESAFKVSVDPSHTDELRNGVERLLKTLRKSSDDDEKLPELQCLFSAADITSLLMMSPLN
jgi:hypothetical protein